jgi:hypothetical protein
MNHDRGTTCSGEVTDVFAHRFVVRTATGTVLADLGPKGAQDIGVKAGDHVVLWGEMKPSELKVARITKNGGQSVDVEQKKPHPEEHGEADPKRALETAAANGLAVLGAPRRKPKHFEILGRDRGGDFVELHVELDGALRKTRPVDETDPKWAAEIRKSELGAASS